MDVIKVFLDEDAKMPKRAHREDAGFDLFACERKRVNAGSNAVFDTGVHFDIPEGFYGLETA